MSVSNFSADVTARMGGHVSCRHYVARHKCPWCGKRYAKQQLFFAHVRSHSKGSK